MPIGVDIGLGGGGGSRVAHKYATSVGDGVSLTIDVLHNFNTRDVSVSVYEDDVDGESVICAVARPDVNTVRLTFLSAPDIDQYRVVVIA